MNLLNAPCVSIKTSNILLTILSISWESMCMAFWQNKVYQKKDVHFTFLNIYMYITKHGMGIYTLPTLDLQVQGK